MSWKDFLYFSKGERRGFIIILFLIIVGGTWMWYSTVIKQPVVMTQSAVNQTAISKTDIKTEQAPNTQTTTAPNQNRQNQNSDTRKTTETSQKQSQPTDNKSDTQTSTAQNEDKADTEKKEAVTERIQRLTSNSRPSYPQTEKFTEGTVIELNAADTTTLKKIPGIGSAYARRIVSYRNLLGGYFDITQLAEVYGIDEERYTNFIPWFSADPSLIKKLNVNILPLDSLVRHPYISYAQAKVITQLRRQKGKLTGWENLKLLNEFTEVDKIRLVHYLSFE